MFTFAVSAQGDLGKMGIVWVKRVAGWFWFTYLFLDTFSFEMVFCCKISACMHSRSIFAIIILCLRVTVGGVVTFSRFFVSKKMDKYKHTLKKTQCSLYLCFFFLRFYKLCSTYLLYIYNNVCVAHMYV